MNKKNQPCSEKNSVFLRVKKYADMLDDYFEVFLPQSEEIADIESLADYMGLTREELMELMENKKYGKQFRLARNRIAKIKKQLAYRGRLPPAVLSFDLKNNHNYRDKSEEKESDGNIYFNGIIEDWSK